MVTATLTSKGQLTLPRRCGIRFTCTQATGSCLLSTEMRRRYCNPSRSPSTKCSDGSTTLFSRGGALMR